MKKVLLAGCLVAGVAAIYLQTGGFETLASDDMAYTGLCPFVRTGFSWANVRAAFSDVTWGGIYMPVTSMTYMGVISAFGGDPGPQHLVSALFHAVNAVLFFVLLLRLSGGRRPLLCFLAAALWAWHPLRVESVAWIASRKDTVFTFFTLIGLYAWTDRRWCLGFAMMLLACLSKPTAMCFPCLALAVEFLSSPKEGFQWNRRCLLGYASRYAPLFLLAAATGALAAYSQTHADGDNLSMYYAGLPWRLTNAAVALGMDFLRTVVPHGMSVWYRPTYKTMPLGWEIGLPAFAVATAGISLWYWKVREHRRTLLWCALWFFAAIGPTLGIAASFGRQAYADRFTYLPMMAFSVLLVLVAYDAKARATRIVSVVCGVAALAYAIVAWNYTGYFVDEMTTNLRVLKCDPGNADAVRGYGGAILLKTRNPDLAIPYFYKAIRMDPETKAQNDLVFALLQRNKPGDIDEIKRLTARVVENPALDNEGVILDILATIAVRENRTEDALRFLRQMTKVTNQGLAERAKMKLEALSRPSVFLK